MFQVCFKI